MSTSKVLAGLALVATSLVGWLAVLVFAQLGFDIPQLFWGMAIFPWLLLAVLIHFSGYDSPRVWSSFRRRSGASP